MIMSFINNHVIALMVWQGGLFHFFVYRYTKDCFTKALVSIVWLMIMVYLFEVATHTDIDYAYRILPIIIVTLYSFARSRSLFFRREDISGSSLMVFFIYCIPVFAHWHIRKYVDNPNVVGYLAGFMIFCLTILSKKRNTLRK